MRLSEVFTPAIAMKQSVLTEAARIQHAEDLIFWEGSSGAERALDSLEGIQDQYLQDVTLKFDGCVHPDTVLFTDQGEQTILQIVDRFECNDNIKVLGCDLETREDKMVSVNMAVAKTGPKRWVTIHLEDGGSITLTEDHEVHTINRGWVQAKDLTEDDDITEIAKK